MDQTRRTAHWAAAVVRPVALLAALLAEREAVASVDPQSWWWSSAPPH
jgi:hypothetical protein